MNLTYPQRVKKLRVLLATDALPADERHFIRAKVALLESGNVATFTSTDKTVINRLIDKHYART
jgi:hypothetical protein